MKNAINKFIKCEKSISLDDIRELEIDINLKLPPDFISHYLKFNGGIPMNPYWISNNFEPLEVVIFKSIKFNEPEKNNPLSLIGGFYSEMRRKNVMPENILPFACDWGGNLFCIDIVNNNIIFYATDSFDLDVSMEENHKRLQRILTSSFSHFVNGLVEDVPDYEDEFE